MERKTVYPHSRDIAKEIERRRRQLEWLNNDPPSAQIAREIERRKQERARVKAQMRLVTDCEQAEQEIEKD